MRTQHPDAAVRPAVLPAPGAPARLLPETGAGRLAVTAGLALALVLRAAAVLVTRHSYRLLNDAENFDSIALSLIHGHGYGPALVPPAAGPSAFRGVVYPASLGALYRVVGHSVTAGRLEEAVFGTALVAMIGLVAAQLFSRRVAGWALALAAVHPTLILYGTSLQLEPLLAALSLGAVAAALQHRRAPRGWRWPALAGLLIGLSLETREIAVVLALPVAWLLWTASPSPGAARARWAAPVLAGLVAVAVLVPWTIRNEVRLHAFVPISTSGVFALAGTYNATAAASTTAPTTWIPPYRDPALAKILLSRPHPSEVWVDHQLTHAVIRYVTAHPLYPLRAMYWNLVGLFDLQGPRVALAIAPYVPYSRGLVRLAVYSSYLLGVLALIGAALPARRHTPGAVWAIPLSAIVLLAFVSGNIRYRATIEPYTVLLASVAVAAAADRARAGGHRAASSTASSSSP